jgi:site-specific recombinase XerD
VTPLHARYEAYLRQERGLAEKSLRVYEPVVRDFLAARFCGGSPARPDILSAQDVRDFLLRRVRRLSPATAKSAATALRSFLRFLFLRGEVATDLSLAVPAVRCVRGRKVHPYLRPEAVEQLLGACDVATAAGRRDHAVLLLLARLGMRSSEVVALSLDDIRWRTGEVVVRGKGGVVDRLPLLPDVGEGLALYVLEARGRSDSRRVFLRLRAPRVGLTSQTAVGSVVRRTLARAGLRPSLRGAHLLRYSLATTMIRHGASMAEIGQVLRHRSPETTEVYAKVEFEALRDVAPSWPGRGGAR